MVSDHHVHRSIGLLLMAATDGAAQLFVPGRMGNADRFEKFVTDNFPFDGVQASKKEVIGFLWNQTRNSFVHRFGLTTIKSIRKFGRTFTITDADFERLETSQVRPNKPFYECDATRTVVWIEAYYWELRQAIVKAQNTPGIDAWIESGDWDHSR